MTTTSAHAEAEALGNQGLAALARVAARNAAVAGDFENAVTWLKQAITRGDARPFVLSAFVDALSRLRDLPPEWDVGAALVIAAASDYVLPYTAVLPALLVLKGDPVFDQAFASASQGDAAGIKALLETGRLQPVLAAPLLLNLLRMTVVSGPELEFILTETRRFLLGRAAAATPAEQNLAEALAEQCFLNEYAFFARPEEQAAAANLPDGAFSSVIRACYRPLALGETAPARLVHQQITEPAEERMLAGTIPRLAPVTAEVSRTVQALYEENPYPRWVKPYRTLTRPTRELYRLRYPGADFTRLDQVTAPDILVAGCGTGFNLMMSVAGYADYRLTALDLSRASLAHAARHIKALSLPHIELLQGDILDLHLLPKTFDIIEAFGVLHHMADPLAGARKLAEKLRPGGVMQLALYSTVAHAGLDRLRRWAAARGYAMTRDGIALFRRDALAALRDPRHPDWAIMEAARLETAHDFYSVSNCRDLVFHPQETTFTLPRVAQMIADLGLRFTGFSFPSPAYLAAYRQRFPNDPAGLNLANWDRFEQENPLLFARMYNFVLQKPA